MKSPIKRLARTFVSNVLGLYLAQFILTGFSIEMNNYQTILLAGGALVVVNFLLKPILKLISFPINVITLGFFELIINALLLYLVILIIDGISLTPGVLDLGYLGIVMETIKLSKFGTLVASALTISIINWLLKILIF